MDRFIRKLRCSRIGIYLQCLVPLLVVAGVLQIPYVDCAGCSIPLAPFPLREGPPHAATTMTVQGQFAEIWLEGGVTGTFTPTTTAQGMSLVASEGNLPPFLDELAEKGYVAIRVPHAPPTYTQSSLVPGIPPWEPDAALFSCYSPPSTTTLTTIPVAVTRRTDLEGIVNTQFPIPDAHSHWEVWWLPAGERFPIPDQPFRLDEGSWPTPLALRFRIDFVDAHASACAGCPVEILAYNGYVFIGPYQVAIRYDNAVAAPEPLVAFGVHCGYDVAQLAPSVGQYITPTVPFTHVHCLENWDAVTRTFTINASSSQGWNYAYYYQETTAGSVPVPVVGVPFAVAVAPRPEDWSPGRLALLAVHTPAIAVTDTLRETFTISATSTVSPAVRASAVSFALAPGYKLNEVGQWHYLYLPLVLKN